LNNKKNKIMNVISINGKVHTSKGNISISNGKVVIDGIDQTPNDKVITISVEGNIDSLDIDYCQTVRVNGNINQLRSTSGDVECNDVTGKVTTTSGDVECENIGGDIKTISGDVKGKTIHGNVNTMSGDIKYRKWISWVKYLQD